MGHHLIVTHELTNEGTDRAKLSSVGQQAREALGTEKITVLADRGHYAGPEIRLRASQDQRAGAQVPYVRQPGQGAVRQARLPLHRREG
jgi:hypothetical protein